MFNFAAIPVAAKVAVSAAATVAVAGSVGGYAVYQNHVIEEQKAFDDSVVAAYDGYEDEVNSFMPAEGATHQQLLDAHENLTKLKDKVNKDELTLHDGTLYSYDKLMADIDAALEKTDAMLLDAYNKTLAENEIDLNAEGVSKDDINAKVANLKALLELIESDKKLGIEFDESKLTTLVETVNGKVESYTNKVTEIEKAEEEAKAAAQTQTQAAAAQGDSGYNGGGYDSYSGGDYGYSGGGADYSYSGGGSSYSGGRPNWDPYSQENYQLTLDTTLQSGGEYFSYEDFAKSMDEEAARLGK